MGVGSIFVATTLAPLVIVLASVSLQIFTIGLEQLKTCEYPGQGAVLQFYSAVLEVVFSAVLSVPALPMAPTA